jgi:hypothetical protein
VDGLVGLTALAGYQTQIDVESEASPEQRSGGSADARHGTKTGKTQQYPWEANLGQAGMQGPHGTENQMLGDEFWFIEEAGTPDQDPFFDHTPSRRAGPWPKGILSGPMASDKPDDVAYNRALSVEAHGVRTNAGARSIGILSPLQDDWTAIDNVTPGHTELQPLPKQAMSSGFGFGTRDRTQSMAAQNQYGFDSAHVSRRYAQGSIPGNYMWMRPGGRPMVKSLPGPARPAVGPTSPFAGDDLGVAFGIGGAILQNVPSEYSPPAQPNLAAPASFDDPGPVEWY